MNVFKVDAKKKLNSLIHFVLAQKRLIVNCVSLKVTYKVMDIKYVWFYYSKNKRL
jgi:hypothetical protein